MHLKENRLLSILATVATMLAVGEGLDAVLLGLASGALVLMATGGGVPHAARRSQA